MVCFQQTSATVKTSYEVSLMIAQQKQAHVIGENLVLLAAQVMMHSIFGNESIKKTDSISLSNNAVQLQRMSFQLQEMSLNIFQPVISEISRSESEFAI